MNADPKQSAGKGMRPKIGYNQKNYSEAYDDIDWGHPTKKDNKNEINRRTKEFSGSDGKRDSIGSGSQE